MNYQTTLNNEFKLIKKKHLYHLFALDGDTIGSLNKQITLQINKLIMKTLRGYIKNIEFDVTNLGIYKLILNML